ncbi:MAG: M23 family metallopeptidase [Synergistaceae bacterium]|nr:M23 family metallopeptidase [Synergistaceae bacterium]
MRYKNIKLMLLAVLIALSFNIQAHAGKWNSMTLSDNLQEDIKKLEDYCFTHDLKLADVLWANKISEADLTPGQEILLPKSQVDVLSLWQNQGAWQQGNALLQKTSAAAAERARGVSGYKPKAPANNNQVNNNLPQVNNNNKNNYNKSAAELDILAQISQKQEPIKPKVKENAQANLNRNSQAEADILAQISKRPEPIKPKVKEVAKANNNNDPVILLSPNGDPANGPMRLVIGDDGQISVVNIPKSSAPRVPKMPDLDHPFGAHLIKNPVEPIPPYDPSRLYPKFQRNVNQAMMWPVDGKVSSPFGPRGKRRHTGIDIPMPPGTPIMAARDGVVAKTGNNSTMGFRGYGNFVLVDHGGGVKTLYAHCLNVNVKAGQHLRQGQAVATVGRTGRASTDHLHFEVRINDKPVNPMPYLENVRVASKR